jgi:hypothetical protein
MIHYAAAFRFHCYRLWNTRSPGYPTKTRFALLPGDDHVGMWRMRARHSLIQFSTAHLQMQRRDLAVTEGGKKLNRSRQSPQGREVVSRNPAHVSDLMKHRGDQVVWRAGTTVC